MRRSRWAIIILTLALMLVAWVQVWRSQQGLTVRRLTRENVPMIFMAPAPAAEPVPGVLIAHGFSGSKQLMLGYGHVLAQAGYGVLLWDRAGHGSNPTAFGSGESDASVFDGSEAPEFRVAWEALRAQPEVDGDRLALLGHSLGGGTVLRAGVEYPEDFSATIAISSVPAPVDAARPRNLQLQIGEFEFGMLQQTAQQVLAAAGGENEQLEAGLGRSLLTIPKVEHSTILFADRSHAAARDWLNRTFGRGPGADAGGSGESYRDRRMAWYLVHLLAGLGLAGAIAPLVAIATVEPAKPKSTWLGLLAAPVVAGAGLLELSRHVELATLGGIQVGGAVALWFLIGGAVWLGFVGRISGLRLRNLGVGLLLFALLWVAFGLMAQWVWLPWLLIPARLQVWPLLALGCFPWFLAAGLVSQGAGWGRRLLIWLVQSLVLIVGFGLAAFFVPSLFFMLLLLPFFPLVIGMLSWVGAFYDDAWTGAIASSLFFGWILAALFPLA